MYTKKRKHYNM